MIGESRRNKSSELNMSWLELESILPYIDAHKRLSISICSPWFRKLEKQTYIYFDELELEPSKIKINNKYYKFGECLDIEKTSELDDRNVKSIKACIGSTNFQGGTEWRSMEDDVPEPGDIALVQSPRQGLEQQKIEKMNQLRHSFMEELEKYFKSEIMVNPLDVFEHSVTECNVEWPTEFKKMFDRIYRSSLLYFNHVFWKHPLLENEDRPPVQPDDLSDMYPNAFNLMKSKIEEMNRKGDVRVSALEMLAYPPAIVPHFNQFTVLGIFPEYSNRIPDGFSIRKAIKHFLSVILEGRKNIRVGKFKLDGYGIIPLPVGLKFDCDEVDFYRYSFHGDLIKANETLLGRVDRMNIKDSWGFKKMCRCEMIRNCKQLFIRRSGFRMDEWESELKDLYNEVIFVEIYCAEDINHLLVNAIRSWTSNTDRKVGSKLYITYRRYSSGTDESTISGELRETGFIMKEDNIQSMSLLLAENKRVELTFSKNNQIVPREFLQNKSMNRFWFLEIVN